ncbi:uncharacterized protein LOC134442605 [Engraulis encrasicolus]|uniref:uncharacterized protein LOC134442605 n=1 Tax=Engraulis encrasicolus TaxID=184585 RepID=UPI002FD6601C
MDNPDGNTRPRREQHQPRHLDDYLVDLPQRRLPQDESHTHTADQSDTEDSRPREVTHTPPAGQTPVDMSAAIYLALQDMRQEMKQDNRLVREDNRLVREDCRQMKEDCRQMKEDNRLVREDCRQMKEDNRQVREDCKQLQREVQFLMEQYRVTPPRSPARDIQVQTVTPGTHSPGGNRSAEGGTLFMELPFHQATSSPLHQDHSHSPAHQASVTRRASLPEPQLQDQPPLPRPHVATTTAAAVTSTPHQRAAPLHTSPLIAELTERVRSMHLPRGQQSSPSNVATPGYAMPYSPRHPPAAPRPQPSSHASAEAPEQYVLPPPPRRLESLPYRETTYRGPKMKIPLFTEDDPRQFHRMQLALDNVLPYDATERFKYQVLLDHLKLEEAALVADAYCHSSSPYSDTMAALTKLFGQPRKLALRQINLLLLEPPVKSGDQKGFRFFALKVQSLVGMLDKMGTQEQLELRTGSHVSRLLPKLPHELRAAFRRYIDPVRVPVPTLRDFADWLEHEVAVQMDDTIDPPKAAAAAVASQPEQQRGPRGKQSAAIQPTTVLLVDPSSNTAPPSPQGDQPKKYCPFCNSQEHYFNQCSAFKNLSLELRSEWVKAGNKCWRCGRGHQAAQCYLKARCGKCDRRHLEILHEVNNRNKPETAAPSSASQPATYYLDPASRGSSVLLKMVKVHLYHRGKRMETYAILDDGSERTMLLHPAAQQLGLQGPSEDLALRTIRQDIRTVPGMSVSFSVSSISHPQRQYKIQRAFTSPELGLSPHSHPVEALKKTYRHLRGLPLNSLTQVQPLLLIGSDYPDLLMPIQPVHVGPPGCPVALQTRLGWTLQGPAKAMKHHSSTSSSLCTGAQAPASHQQSANHLHSNSGRLAQAAANRHQAVSSASSPADSPNWRLPLRQLHPSSSAPVVHEVRKGPQRTPIRARHGAAGGRAATQRHSSCLHPKSAVPHSRVEGKQHQQHHSTPASEPHRPSHRGQMGRPRHRTHHPPTAAMPGAVDRGPTPAQSHAW